MQKRSLCHLETGRSQLVAEGGLDTYDTSNEAVLASWGNQAVWDDTPYASAPDVRWSAVSWGNHASGNRGDTTPCFFVSIVS
jgi:hypothetical protein